MMGEKEKLIEESLQLLEEILLCGFHNVHPAIYKEIQTLEIKYDRYGLFQGKKLLQQLYNELLAKKNHSSSGIGNLTTSFTQLEFYLSCL